MYAVVMALPQKNIKQARSEPVQVAKMLLFESEVKIIFNLQFIAVYSY